MTLTAKARRYGERAIASRTTRRASGAALPTARRGGARAVGKKDIGRSIVCGPLLSISTRPARTGRRSQSCVGRGRAESCARARRDLRERRVARLPRYLNSLRPPALGGQPKRAPALRASTGALWRPRSSIKVDTHGVMRACVDQELHDGCDGSADARSRRALHPLQVLAKQEAEMCSRPPRVLLMRDRGAARLLVRDRPIVAVALAAIGARRVPSTSRWLCGAGRFALEQQMRAGRKSSRSNRRSRHEKFYPGGVMAMTRRVAQDPHRPVQGGAFTAVVSASVTVR